MRDQSLPDVAIQPSTIPVPVELGTIKHRNRVFSLAQPIRVNVELDKDLWVLECRPLRILAYGESRERALASFCEDFADLYDHIGGMADENLTDDARELKMRMIGLTSQSLRP